jgi:hypothetical protein
MDLLPPFLQLLVVLLDVYLITQFPAGMAKNYLIFTLVRSLIRAYAQWFMTIEGWRMVYWWGELVGYIVVIILIAGVTERLLHKHVNTATFYASIAIIVTVTALWRLPHPLSLHSLWRVGITARLSALFLLLMAMVLGDRWTPLAKWIGFGIAISLITQWVGGWFEVRGESQLMVTMVSQLGFLCLQLSWLVGILRLTPMPVMLMGEL